MRDRLGPSAAIEQLRRNLPTLAETLPELAHRLLGQLENGNDPFSSTRRELQAIREELVRNQRRNAWMMAGTALVLAAALIFGLDGFRPAMLGDAPVLTWLCALAGSWAWWKAARLR